LGLLGLIACHAQNSKLPADIHLPPGSKTVAPGVFQIGRIENPRITESSGVAASRRYPGVFWTHVDGGGPKKQVLYAINREGKSLGDFFVTDALLVDWEDITLDDQNHLFIGDIGNNDAKRSELAVYQIDEPDPKSKQAFVRPTRLWRLRFPTAPFDCESLFVWQGYGYVVSKVFEDARAQIFRFPLTDTKEPLTLELVATTKIESPVTSAAISADGKRLALVAKSGAYLYQIDGHVSKVIKGKPQQAKFRHEHIEGCCFVPEGLLTTAESREIFLFTEEAFQGK
jgi:hypothetical protein